MTGLALLFAAWVGGQLLSTASVAAQHFHVESLQIIARLRLGAGHAQDALERREPLDPACREILQAAFPPVLSPALGSHSSPFEGNDSLEANDMELGERIKSALELHDRGLDGQALKHLRSVLVAVGALDLLAIHPGFLADLEVDVHEAVLIVLRSHALSAAELQEHGAFLEAFESARLDPLAAARQVLDEAVAEADRRGWSRFFPGNWPAAAAAGRSKDLWNGVLDIAGPVEGRAVRLQALTDEDDGRILKRIQAVFVADGLRRMFARAVKIGCALAAFEVMHGRFPDRLEYLVPGYVQGALVCPYSGRPFSGSVQQGRIWSPAFDGIDDQGKPLPTSGRPRLALRICEDPGDLVVQVGRKAP